MRSAATSKTTKKPVIAGGKPVSKAAKPSTTSKKKATGVSAAQKAAASAAIPVMADTGKKLSPGMSINLPGNLPVKLSRRNKTYSVNSHRTKDRIPLQISLPPLLVQQMKAVKLLKGVSMVDQIIHCMEAAGYEVDDSAKAAMTKRYSSE